MQHYVSFRSRQPRAFLAPPQRANRHVATRGAGPAGPPSTCNTSYMVRVNTLPTFATGFRFIRHGAKPCRRRRWRAAVRARGRKPGCAVRERDRPQHDNYTTGGGGHEPRPPALLPRLRRQRAADAPAAAPRNGRHRTRDGAWPRTGDASRRLSLPQARRRCGRCVACPATQAAVWRLPQRPARRSGLTPVTHASMGMAAGQAGTLSPVHTGAPAEEACGVHANKTA